MAIPAVEEVSHVYSYLLLESMGFDTDISDGVAKMRAATLLGDIFRLHQCAKNPQKYVHTKSNYGHLVVMIDSDTQEYFSRAAREKCWVEKSSPFLRQKGGK